MSLPKLWKRTANSITWSVCCLYIYSNREVTFVHDCVCNCFIVFKMFSFVSVFWTFFANLWAFFANLWAVFAHLWAFSRLATATHGSVHVHWRPDRNVLVRGPAGEDDLTPGNASNVPTWEWAPLFVLTFNMFRGIRFCKTSKKLFSIFLLCKGCT